MLVILAIDAIVAITLYNLISTRGLERALPAFVFFVTLLPEECRLPIPGLFDLYTRRLALIIITIAFFSQAKKSAASKLPLKRLLLIHGSWVLVSTAASIVTMTSVKQVLAQVIEYYLTYYIFYRTISDVRTIYKLGLAMIAAVGVACLFGSLESYAGWSVLSIFPAEMQLTYGTGSAVYAELLDRGIRARSVFPHPILFGGGISMLIPMTLYFITTVKKPFQKVWLNAVLILMFWNLFKTSSRGPWLATALSMSILVLAAKPQIRKKIWAMGALAVGVLILRPGVAETLWNMYVATMDPTSRMGASYYYRPVLLHTVTQTLLDNPFRGLVGFGLGSFREKGLILVLPGIETHRWFTCDSAWILFTYETGYVGFLLIAALLMTPAILALRGYFKLPRPERHFSLICFSSFVSFFFVMLSVAVYAWGQNGHMLWILVAMSMSYLHLAKKKPQSGSSAPAGEERSPAKVSELEFSWAVATRERDAEVSRWQA